MTDRVEQLLATGKVLVRDTTVIVVDSIDREEAGAAAAAAAGGPVAFSHQEKGRWFYTRL